jgi:hypothetical protein
LSNRNRDPTRSGWKEVNGEQDNRSTYILYLGSVEKNTRRCGTQKKRKL